MTVFSKIISGQIPCYKIAEDDKFFAFLDINPLVEGHTLIIPKLEIDNFFDVPEDFLKEIFIFSKPIAKAIQKSFDCNRCGVSIIGLEVPHAHMHLVPINTVDDLNFTRKKIHLPEKQMQAAQAKIVKALEKDRF
jgi:histidine triad (HIT) family protein